MASTSSTEGSRPGPILVVTGCTASGKSALALGLARRIGGEILAADSMQVYRGLDIGTAKPTEAERATVPHHLIDLVEPGEDFDAARWLQTARSRVREVRSRGRVPIFCGGTGLYLRAWFLGLDAPGPRDPDLRRQLEALPREQLLEELRLRDPASHDRVDRHNPRRVVRAVEILRLTGRPLDWKEPEPFPSPGDADRVFVLQRGRDDLRERVDRRVDAMFEQGLVDETRRLRAEGLGGNRTACQAIGYRQVLEHLEGVRDLPSTVAWVKTRTWQYVRRQETWFRHQLRASTVMIGRLESEESVLERVLSGLGHGFAGAGREANAG